jgi:hypothetical protein
MSEKGAPTNRPKRFQPNCELRQNLVLVALANAASDDHSPSYRKYFRSVGRGRYRVRDEYRGLNWR